MAEDKRTFRCPRCGHRDIRSVPRRDRCPRCGSPVGAQIPWEPDVTARPIPRPQL